MTALNINPRNFARLILLLASAGMAALVYNIITQIV
jgi:hypothetical protein